jgi:hypothetical protein
MLRKILCAVNFLVVVILLPLPSVADTITDAMRTDDPRLNKIVTFMSPRIYVGELLEKLSAQTGVIISASERDGAADEQIAVFLPGVRLGDALDVLWSLLSYKAASYHWERNGEPSNYHYRLVRPSNAQRLPARLSGLSQEIFEQMTAMLMDASTAEPEVRKQIVARMVKELLQGDQALVNGYLDTNDRTWTGLALFKESLSPEKQANVLRDQNAAIQVPVSQLNEQGQRFVHSVWEDSHAKRKRNGVEEAVPEPGFIRFKISRSLKGQVAPILVITIEGIGGYGYAGGTPLEKALRKRIADLWMLTNDSTNNPAASRVVTMSQKLEPAEKRPSHAFEFRLAQISEAASVPIMARIPDGQIDDPGPAFEHSVQDFLSKIKDVPPYCQNKWKNNILLIDYPTWFQDQPATGTWQLVKQLRLSQQANSGFLPLEDLAVAANRLTPAQLNQLGNEFPVLKNVADLQEIFNATCLSKQTLTQLTSKSGLALTEEIRASLSTEPYLKTVLEQGNVRTVRLTEEEHKDQDPPTREVTFGFVTTEGKWVPVRGFIYKEIKPK